LLPARPLSSRIPTGAVLAAVLAAASVAPAGALQAVGAGASACARAGGPGGSSDDLYCIELFPAAGIDDASGRVELGRVPSPFGIAVTQDGHHRYQLVFHLDGLPDPASLGPYTTYVAWAATPTLDPVLKLGVVNDGRTVAGRVAFDQFLVLITAEASGDVEERAGRLVLRGMSPSMRLQPHDATFVVAGMLEARDAPAHGAHAAHRHPADQSRDERAAPPHGQHADGSRGHHGGAPHVPPDPDLEWGMPPMHPAIRMPEALMRLRPGVLPYLPRAPAGLLVPAAQPRQIVPLADGDTMDLVAGLVRRSIGGREHLMYGFNGQYPGPLVQVDEGATILFRFHNETDFSTAVHWHGIRLANAFDGVPGVTQDPVAPGSSFEYRVHFPDPGIYWYHPHQREDVLQGLGLYGNLQVAPEDSGYWGPAHREEALILDDLLVGDDGLVPFGRETPTHALMGRFGNVLLVNGEPDYRLSVRRGEVVRFLLTNAASARTFNLSFGPGARMKVVATDIGRFEREEWVESVVIAPAERYVVDVRFDEPGDVALMNRVRPIDPVFARFFQESDTLGVVRVAAEPVDPELGAAFERLRSPRSVAAEMSALRPHLERAAELELVLSLETTDLPFPLVPLLSFESVYRHPVEWSGTMPEMDGMATGREIQWTLVDPATGRRNMDIDWRFRVGDLVRLRITNERDVLHAMQHPIHVHGQRFLVLSVNGVPTDNLAWKDTVLVPTGATAEILLELSNPGQWMIHCHIVEHLETGMMMVFTVDP
jgi:suppressor of ftsI